MKRKICLVLTTRGNYAKSKSLIWQIERHPNLELQIVVGGGLVLDKYGKILDDKVTHQIQANRFIHFVVEGETPLTMTKSAGLAILECATAFSDLDPDIVVVLADRFECLSIAMAAAYMNIPVAHIEGGEVSGSIDESIRHAITKLAHIHFPASEEARNRIIQLGERKDMVFQVGASSIDALTELDLNNLDPLKTFCETHGVGSKQFLEAEKYLLVVQHSVTTEYQNNHRHVQETVKAIIELGLPTVWVWPNMDAGSDGVSKAIREFRESGEAINVYFFKSLPIEIFGPLLKNAACILGNSSSGIREASFLGTPSVNIGSRQHGRYKGVHSISVRYNHKDIIDATRSQVQVGPYESDRYYGQGGSAKEMVNVLADIEITIQK